MYDGEYEEVVEKLKKFIGKRVFVETIFIKRLNESKKYSGIVIEVLDTSSFYLVVSKELEKSKRKVAGVSVDSCQKIYSEDGEIIFERK